MSKKRARRPYRRAAPGRARWPSGRLALAGLAGVGVLGVAILVILAGPGRSPGGATPWARLGTADVHALAFVDDDPAHLLFGHHHGLLETLDGGRTWRPLGTQADAMEMAPAGDGSIVIAGHEVFTASRDGGVTWSDIPADLPSLDLHGFARDPGDAARMWAFPTSGGLWESRAGGLRRRQAPRPAGRRGAAAPHRRQGRRRRVRPPSAGSRGRENALQEE